MERQIQRKTSQDLGDGAELDLYEILRESFPDDRITRVQKGQPGADIHHEVMYKGQCCGKIVIDSKNRHGWQNAFVTKLRQDQTENGVFCAGLGLVLAELGDERVLPAMPVL